MRPRPPHDLRSGSTPRSPAGRHREPRGSTSNTRDQHLQQGTAFPDPAKAMASSALCCSVRQMLVHVYRGISKAFCQPRDTVHLGRRGRPVQKPRLMPLLTALSVARKLQATRIGTVSVLFSPWPLPSPSASSSSRRGSIAAGCGSGCLIALAAPQRAAGWCCAARPCGGRGSCGPPMAQGHCGGCERSKGPPCHPGREGRGAVGRGCADRAVVG